MERIKYKDYKSNVEAGITNAIEELKSDIKSARSVAYALKSNNPQDMYLFYVIGYEVINGIESWCLWNYNHEFGHLYSGVYRLTSDEAWERFNDYTNCNYCPMPIKKANQWA